MKPVQPDPCSYCGVLLDPDSDEFQCQYCGAMVPQGEDDDYEGEMEREFDMRYREMF